MEHSQAPGPRDETATEGGTVTDASTVRKTPPDGISPDAAAAALRAFNNAGAEGEEALRARQADPDRMNPEQH